MSRQRAKCFGPARYCYLVLGGACLDTFTATPSVTLGGKNRVRTLLRTGGGGGLNVALGLRAQDPEADVLLLTGTGDDANGEALRGLAAARGVEIPWGVVPGQPTSTSLIVTEPQSGRSTIFSEMGARTEPTPLGLVQELLPGCDVCWLVAPTCSGQVRPVVALANRLGGIPVFLGVGGAQIDLGYAGLGDQLAGPVALLVCNRQEAFRLTGQTRVTDQLESLKFGGRVRTVVITDGASGLHGLHEGRIVHMPPYSDAREVVDETGAGDAAQSVIGRWLLQGQSLEAALCAGARQGFEAVTALGATARQLSEAELRAHVKGMGGLAA
jgi:sugar/nucleoside kinase (ribokinase family)